MNEILGACRKRHANGDVDGCGLFVVNTDGKTCEACGCHRSFHVQMNITTALSPTNSASGLTAFANITTQQPRISIDTSNVIALEQQPISSSSSESSVSTNIHQATPQFPEYPDGDLTITINAHDFDDYSRTGWATRSRSAWKLKGYAAGRARKCECLGVMRCVETDCMYVVRPAVNAKKWVSQLMNTRCHVHNTELIHIRCKATITWKEYTTPSSIIIHEMIHENMHEHPKPPPIRAPPSAHRKFVRSILNAPATRPKQLLVGSSFTDSVRTIHPTYTNLDRLACHRRKALKNAEINAHVHNILEWQAQNPGFIVGSSLGGSDGYIFMQTETQLQLCQRFVGPLQTDALESFVEGPGNAVLCVTSGYVETISRTVPLACTIIFGKTEDHYRKHFNHLFKSLDMVLKQTDDGDAYAKSGSELDTKSLSLSWSCMVVDFSTAQHMAFLHEFREAVVRKNPGINSQEGHMLATSYIRGCQIHYFRSVVRIARIQSVVPPDQSSQFVQLVTELVNCEISRFKEIIDIIKLSYPLTEKWLNWYLHEDRAKLIYKCYSQLGSKWNTTIGNTNAQEGTGRDIKFTATSTRLSLFQVVDHLHRYTQLITADIEHTSSGKKIRYERKKRKKVTRSKKQHNINDGRPPDTTAQLLPSQTLSKQTPYKLAYIANVQSQATSQLHVHKSASPPRTISFLQNKDASCYASSMLFIMYNILKYSFYFSSLSKRIPESLMPPNLRSMLDVCEMVRNNQFTTARTKLMDYIWNHEDGAPKGKTMSYTKFVHVFLENHPSLDFCHDSIFRSITGVTYIQHTECKRCGYANKVVYNSMFECGPHHVQELDNPACEPVDLANILNYRHYHSHDVSSCPQCSSERKQCYSIVDIPLVFIINLEGIRTSSTEIGVSIPLKMTVNSVIGPINLTVAGWLTHLPGHWTSSTVCPGDDDNSTATTYHFDDLQGYATINSFNDVSQLNSTSTSGIVYLRDRDEEVFTHEIVVHDGEVVTLLNNNREPVAKGYVLQTFIHSNIIIVLISDVLPNHKDSSPCFSNNRMPKTLGDYENSRVVWDTRFAQVMSSNSQKTSATIETNTSKPGDAKADNTTRKKRQKLQHKRAPMSIDSVSSSDYDINVERVKSKTRRDAQPIYSSHNSAKI
jgi:hypothetical protein